MEVKMNTGIQEIKTAAKMREWSTLIAECRSSGKSVKAWCSEKGISWKTYYRWEKCLVAEAARQMSLSVPVQNGSLIRIDPNTLPDSSNTAAGSQITIRHGESMIFLPAGSGIGSVADLVKALNCHA